MLLKEQEEDAEPAEEGQGELEMPDVNQNLVRRQLSELEQQVEHVVNACNAEKDVIEEEFETVRNGIEILEARLVTEEVRIEAEVQGVGHPMHFQEAILQELRSNVRILKAQDDQIVQEASDLFEGHQKEMQNLCKRINDNSIQILAVKASNQSIQKSIAGITKRIDEVNKTMVAITDAPKNVPSRRELRKHTLEMDEWVAQIQEINTGLTTALDGCKSSETTHQGVNLYAVMQASTSKQPEVHPSRGYRVESSSYESSLQDTASAQSWTGRFRGGAGDGNPGDSNAGDGNGGDGRAETEMPETEMPEMVTMMAPSEEIHHHHHLHRRTMEQVEIGIVNVNEESTI